MKNLVKSFKYAINGIISAFKSERNMKIHFIFMILVVILGIILKMKVTEWIILIILFMAVIGSELFNTAIEITVDLAMPKYNEKAKIAKDISAGAVLFTAIGSLIIGLILFLPKIINFINNI